MVDAEVLVFNYECGDAIRLLRPESQEPREPITSRLVANMLEASLELIGVAELTVPAQIWPLISCRPPTGVP